MKNKVRPIKEDQEGDQVIKREVHTDQKIIWVHNLRSKVKNLKSQDFISKLKKY